MTKFLEKLAISFQKHCCMPLKTIVLFQMFHRFGQRRFFASQIDKFVSSKLSPEMLIKYNHPAGPKTIHFWAPTWKWALVFAGLGDYFRLVCIKFWKIYRYYYGFIYNGIFLDLLKNFRSTSRRHSLQPDLFGLGIQWSSFRKITYYFRLTFRLVSPVLCKLLEFWCIRIQRSTRNP